MPAAPDGAASQRLVMRGIAKAFGATIALASVDLEIGPGQVLALIGENGAGKSTLMKILSGAYQPDAGSMAIDGAPYHPAAPPDARARGVAIVYQELSLARHLSVEENILLGSTPSLAGFVRRSRQRSVASAALAELGCVDIRPQQLVEELSVAQQQLVEIARALAANPRLLVLDEPTSSLTASEVQRLFDVIALLRRRGVSIIYISHALEECHAVADRYAVLRDGRSVASGRMTEVTDQELIRHMVGRDVGDVYPRTPHTQGAIVLELTDLAGPKAPRSVDLQLHQGEILGIFGLVGSGRTETLRVLFGLDPRERGSVLHRGQVRTHADPRDRLRDRIGMVSENRKTEGLFLNLSIAENMTMTRFAPFLRGGLISQAAQHRTTADWMAKLAVKAQGPSQTINDLSGGNQQKVAIGRLLHHRADILLLDEPTRGIDIGAKVHIYRLIGEIAAQGAAIIVVSSYIPELLGICDSIAVMCRGRLTPAKPVGAWDEHRLLAAAIAADPGVVTA